MNALRLFVITATLLLSAGCSGALPLENDEAVDVAGFGGPDNPQVETPDRPCGDSGIALSAACKGAVHVTP